jgi:hypothetical protein
MHCALLKMKDSLRQTEKPLTHLVFVLLDRPHLCKLLQDSWAQPIWEASTLQTLVFNSPLLASTLLLLA